MVLKVEEGGSVFSIFTAPKFSVTWRTSQNNTLKKIQIKDMLFDEFHSQYQKQETHTNPVQRSKPQLKRVQDWNCREKVLI